MTVRATGQLDNVREQFVEELWKGMLLLALIGAPLSLSRAAFTGWLPMYGVHLALGVGVVGIYLNRARLPLALKSMLILLVLWVLGLFGMFTLGFPATSLWWLVLSCLVASTLYSVKVGAALGAATAAVVAIAAFLFTTGRLQLAINAEDYLRQPAVWASLLLVTGTFTFTVLRSNWAYHRSLDRLLEEVNQQRDRIEHMAMHDSLTGLPLSRLADDRIAMALRAAQRSGRKVALLFIDLDDFKAVNDGLGHQAGDAVLQEVAKRLSAAIRAEDTVARIGGDELLAVLGDLGDETVAAMVAERIIRAIARPIDYQGQRLAVGASVGISLYPDHARDPQELRKLADKAMYSAKKSGKNCFAFAGRNGVTA